MSMLAGPRRKQKWTLNPRGKHWSEDTNKFGQKMLEKMGWTNGKGLGAKEQGMVEHVRVRVKNDQVGIGYTKDRDDQWTEHQDDFNNFLQNLQKAQTNLTENSEESDKVLSGKSLEEKSKSSQKRVHYKKFTRGKDVNKYSTKDLANIFGKKDLNEKPIKEEEEENDEKIYDPVGTKDLTAGILTVKGGDMNEYFKNKFNNDRSNFINGDKDNSENEIEKPDGFGYNTKNKSKFYINDANNIIDEDFDTETEKYTGFGFSKSNETKSKNKKLNNLNNLNYVFDNPCLDLNILDNDSLPRKIKKEPIDLENAEKVTPRKRKNEFIYDNPGLDLEYPERPTPKKIKLELIVENESLNNEYNNTISNLDTSNKSKSKKNKKIKHEPVESNKFIYENKGLDVESLDQATPKGIENVKTEQLFKNSATDLETSDQSIKKESKKNKSKFIENSESMYENNDLYLNNESISEQVLKFKTELYEYDNPALDLETDDKMIRKRSKKIKQECTSIEIENPVSVLDHSNEQTPKKSKKKKENQSFSNGTEIPESHSEFSETLTPKKNKKFKKSKKSSNESINIELYSEPKKVANNDREIEMLTNGIENPGLDLDFTEISIPKKMKKNKENDVLSNGFENPGLDLDFSDILTPKKMKKNKESDVLSNGFENPGLDLDYPTKENNNTTDFEVSRSVCGIENNALDLSDENSSKKKVTFNDQVEYNTDIVKKKKKKKKLDKYEVVNEKLKKQNTSLDSLTFTNEALDLEIINEEEIDNELNEKRSKKSKRRKQRRISLLETIEEAPEEENFDEIITEEKRNENSQDVQFLKEVSVSGAEEFKDKNSASKKCKKKKSKKDEIDLGNQNIYEIDISEEQTRINKIKKKKKKSESVEILEFKNKVTDSMKENVCDEKDKIKSSNSISKKEKRKKPSAEDVVSLEEFLNEENVEETMLKHKKKFGKFEISKSDIIEIEDDDNAQNSFQKFRKSKQAMKLLFVRNPTLLFNGSNINEIKGYGSHLKNY